MTNPTAAMLVIGDEILSGRTRDGNTHYLAGQLTQIGIRLMEVRVVADEAEAIIEAVNALRVRAFPFVDEIADFVQSHSKVFVIEQNRDAQMKTLLVNDAGINPASLIPVLHFDGTPITARFIAKEIAQIVAALNVRPIKRDKAA